MDGVLNIQCDSGADGADAAVSSEKRRKQQKTHLGGGKWKHINQGKAKFAGTPIVTKSTHVQSPSAIDVSSSLVATPAATSTATTAGTAAAGTAATTATTACTAATTACTAATTATTAISPKVPIFIDLTAPQPPPIPIFIDLTAFLVVGDTLRFRKDFAKDDDLEEHVITKIVLWTKIDPCDNGPETKYYTEYIVHFGGERWVSALYDERLFEKVGTDAFQPLTDYTIVESTTRKSWDVEFADGSIYTPT